MNTIFTLLLREFAVNPEKGSKDECDWMQATLRKNNQGVIRIEEYDDTVEFSLYECKEGPQTRSKLNVLLISAYREPDDDHQLRVSQLNVHTDPQLLRIALRIVWRAHLLADEFHRV